MAVMKKKGGKSLPPISTASLPDVIFMILFFFMISTTMRDQELLVRYKLPTATEVQKLEKKSLVSFIHIGQPTPIMQAKFGTAPRIQRLVSYGEGYSGLHRRRTRQTQRVGPSADDRVSESRRPDENGYHHRREAGTSPGKRLEALLRRFEVDGILNSRSYTKTIRCSCIGSFFICRDHIRTIVRKNSRGPDRSGSNPVEDCSATRSGRMPAERRARPHPNSDRAHRPAFRRWNPSLLPRPQPSRSAPLAEAATQHKRAKTIASAFPRRSSVCPIPRNTIK